MLAPLFDKPAGRAGDVAQRPRCSASAFRRRNTTRWPAATATWRAVLRARLEKLACDFPPRRQLLRLAGLRPRAMPRRGEAAAALSATRATSTRSARGVDRVEHAAPRRSPSYLAGSADAARRPLRPARRAGLDDRRAAQRAVGARSPARPGPARASSSAPPPSRRCCPAASPTRCSRAGATQRRSRATSAERDRSAIYGGFHLYVMRRLMRGDSPPCHAALMDRLYRRQRHFYDLTRKYYLLGRDRLIAGLDAARRAAACSRSAAAPAAIWSLAARALSGCAASSASTSRPRCWTRRAGSSAGRARRAHRTRARRCHRRSIRHGCSACRLLAHLLLLQPVDDPRLAGGRWPGRWSGAGGRRAAHRRFRRPGAAAGLVPRRLARLAGAVPRQPA